MTTVHLVIDIQKFLMPPPSILDLNFNTGAFRLPPKQITGQLRIADQPCRITRAAVCFNGGNGMTGYCARGLDNFPHREAFAIAQIYMPGITAIE